MYAATEIGIFERLLNDYGIPVSLLVVCVLGLWWFTKKQDYRYDSLTAMHHDLQKEFRAVLMTQITANNEHMGRQTHLMEQMDKHMERQSGFLGRLLEEKQ